VKFVEYKLNFDLCLVQVFINSSFGPEMKLRYKTQDGMQWTSIIICEDKWYKIRTFKRMGLGSKLIKMNFFKPQ
jgi:hypothetical protein